MKRSIVLLLTLFLGQTLCATAEDENKVTVFLGGGKSSGTRTLQTGDPRQPFKMSDTETLYGVFDLRAERFFVSANGSQLRGESKEKIFSAEFRVRPISIGPVRTGLGLEYSRSFTETYSPTTIAYATVRAEHEKQFGFAVADIGIGTYDKSYVRGVFRTGVAHSPTHTSISIFGRTEVLDTYNREMDGQLMHGLGGEFRFAPLRGLALSGSANYYWLKQNTSAVLPDSHTVLKARAAYMSPFHIGIAVDAARATTEQSILPVQDLVAISVGLTF